MPLFGRADGKVIRGLAPVRRMIPYLMKTRNESVVYYEIILDMTRTLPFIEQWNAGHDLKITPFHLIMAACGKMFHARPGLNRFVSGGRIYQRKGCFISFAAKKAFKDDAPLLTVKFELPPGEALADTVRRLHESVGGARTGPERPVDKEVRWAVKLPGFLLRAALWAMIRLDRWNILPGGVTRNDPMYASMFVANLGSVGLDRAWHHLYEYGTVSVFTVIGALRKSVVPGDLAPMQKDTVGLRFSFDERINDGFYCAAALDIIRAYVEDPTLFETQPEPPPAGVRRMLAAGL